MARGERDALVGVHAAQEERHRERADLRVAPASRRRCRDDDLELVAAQRVAVALAADDLRRASCRGPARTRGSAASVSRLPRALTQRLLVDTAWPPMPSARLVIAETAATFRPPWRARIASGTVDMPTASAPHSMPANARISAGVSKLGPTVAR